MWRDPIVEEVRRAGARLSEEAGNNLHQFCENLRKQQKEHGEKLVCRRPRPLLKLTGTNDP